MQAPSNTPQSPHRHPLSLSATLQASYRTLGSLQVRDDYPNARLPSSGVSWARASISNPHACYEPIWVGGSSCLEHSTRWSWFPLPTCGPSWTAAASVLQDNPPQLLMIKAPVLQSPHLPRLPSANHTVSLIFSCPTRVVSVLHFYRQKIKIEKFNRGMEEFQRNLNLFTIYSIHPI